MKDNKQDNKVLKAWKQSNDPLSSDVVQCFKTDLSSISCALIYLNKLFNDKGIINNASKLVTKGLEDFNSWGVYYDILRFEILKYKSQNETYKKEINKLREENLLLRHDKQINNFNSK